MSKIKRLIEELELEYIEFTGKTLEARKASLPLNTPQQIKGMIWNLLTSEKYRKQISYKDYSQIIDILFDRLTN
jgi:hypothetical protein